MTKSTGKLFEKALIGELLQQGFLIPKQDATLDHDAKLDFVIHRFPGSIMHHQVGVQITVGEPNNLKKMQEFYGVHSGRYEKGVQRSVYLQADKDLDLDGGAYVIGSAITQFQFDRRFANERVIGIEVGEDLSYGLFSLKERISAIFNEQSSPVTAPTVLVAGPQVLNGPSTSTSNLRPKINTKGASKATLEGNLTYWMPDDGYGFILAQDGETYYLHFNSVADDKLRAILNTVLHRTRYPLKEILEFEPEAKRSPSDNYPPAKNVRLATGKPFAN